MSNALCIFSIFLNKLPVAICTCTYLHSPPPSLIAGHATFFTQHPSPITHCCSRITLHSSLITHHQSLITHHSPCVILVGRLSKHVFNRSSLVMRHPFFITHYPYSSPVTHRYHSSLITHKLIINRSSPTTDHSSLM